MILTVLRVSLLNLRRDRLAWLLTFIVPVIFFSIFAVIFGGMGTQGLPRIAVAVVDEDGSELSQRLVAALGKEQGLAPQTGRKANSDSAEIPYTRDDAERLVRDGTVPAAILLPRGLAADFPRFDGQGPAIEVLADTSNQAASQMIAGLLQKVVMTGAPDVLMKGNIKQFERFAGQLTESQRQAVERWLPVLERRRADQEPGGAAGQPPAEDAAFGMIPVKVVDLLGETKKNPVVAFYAAATAVMFLLFSCANGGGGRLLEEVENGTLDRLLSSHLSTTQLLIGNWLWLTLVGIVQVTVMFTWGALIFQVELLKHLLGFAVMTAVTAAAASSFGLVIGTMCKTRGQLAGMSTTVILMMSAVGGSMFPRFLMPPFMQTLGLFTFNGWALDGYQKVFWRDAALWELWPQALVLSLLAVGFLLAARVLAQRWERS
jgi:ABC-2 type transport system permease protein